jgi:deoxyribonuclease (pyrimidine dimer)
VTRINVIDPTQLTDQHLMAEYRELPMVMGSLRRTLISKNGWQPAKVSSEYTLNKGHVYFFTNKGGWLKRRYAALVIELYERGFQLDPARKADFTVFEDNGLDGAWTADQSALEVNRARIRERIESKPSWYRYYGYKITECGMLPALSNPDHIWKY